MRFIVCSGPYWVWLYGQKLYSKYFFSSRRKKVLKWHNTRVIIWWQNFSFWINYYKFSFIFIQCSTDYIMSATLRTGVVWSLIKKNYSIFNTFARLPKSLMMKSQKGLIKWLFDVRQFYKEENNHKLLQYVGYLLEELNNHGWKMVKECLVLL